jgi:general stress protein 26
MSKDLERTDTAQLAGLIRDIKVAMLSTTVKGEGLRSRPMFTQETPFDGSLWFMTSAVAPVIKEVSDHPEVLLTYAHPGAQSYVAVNGVGSVHDDRAMIRALWKPAFKVWFPEGAEDPQIRLIRVVVERAEFWDSPSAPVRLFQFARALVTGEQMEGGEHETLRLPMQG